MSTFYERYLRRREVTKSPLCVGFDPLPEKLPAGFAQNRKGWLEFAGLIIENTSAYVTAYKPNLAFFEALPEGDALLVDFIALVRKKAPGALLIADAKRGDISDTARAYARAVFEKNDFDAVTVNPYMGMETLEPFCAYKDRGVIVVCLTSNPGAADYELSGDPPLYERVAVDAAQMNRRYANVWLVAGATREATRLSRLRQLAPDVPFLVPGIGAQGGDLQETIRAVGSNLLINASRSIIYAGNSRKNAGAAAGGAARDLADNMKKIIETEL